MALPKYERNFKGAVGLANWIRNKHWYVHPKDQIEKIERENPQEEDDVVNIAQGGVWPLLKETVKTYRNDKPIFRYYLDYLHTISTCRELDDCFEILVPKTFNVCHRRFALCKELCHILTDDGPFKSHDPIDQLNKALQTVRKVLNSPRDAELSPLFTQTELPSEDFCFLLALDILIPVYRRDEIIETVKVRSTIAINNNIGTYWR